MRGIGKFLTSLLGALPQIETNGRSLWGTLDAPTFSEFLRNNPLPDGFPWGRRTADRSNQYKEMPNTGVTRHYDFRLSRKMLRPDGVRTSVIVVNGQFPGPAIEANWGDWIEVTVHNDLPYEGTAIHWHGMLMRESQWMDGVPSIMQCPIAPHKSFTYRFRASLYGSSWWHAHYSGQYAGGVVGPMIIHGPKHTRYNVDLGPVLLTDWHHRNYLDIVRDLMSNNRTISGPATIPDNNLINGKMAFDCSIIPEFPGDKRQCRPNAGVSHFRFQHGKKHLLRLVNAGADGLQHFSIDEHELTVIAVDFIPIKPYKAKVVSLHIGQRIDVIVEGKNRPDKKEYWMRSKLVQGCIRSAKNPDARAVVHYPGSSRKNLPTSIEWPSPGPNDCLDEPIDKVEPLYPIAIAEPEKTFELEIGFGQNATGHSLWNIDGSSFRANFNDPVLRDAVAGQVDYPENQNIYRTGDAKHFRVVVRNPGFAAHPMHFHGHNMFILAVGKGEWDGQVRRAENPARRDVAVVPAGGHLVVQMEADNPGVWPFHCHIAWHASGGLFANFLEREEDVKKIRLPMTIERSCRQWDEWSKKNIVEHIDSGV